MLVGILALQGDVIEHEAALERIGVATRRIRRVGALKGVDALVLPGGESTTMSMLIDSSGLREELEEWVATERPTLGTCAGLVLMADELTDGRPDQSTLGGLGITVQRNGYGRQRFSFEATVAAPALGDPFEAVFIRAPRILGIDDGTAVLGRLPGTDGGPDEIVIVQRGSLIGCAFHPELTKDDRLHERLVALAR